MVLKKVASSQGEQVFEKDRVGPIKGTLEIHNYSEMFILLS